MADPPTSLVLLHGFASSFEHGWRESGWVDILSDFDCDVPEIDLPGHGSSDRPTDPQDYADVESEVLALLPSTVPGAVGFSAGGDLLLRMAIANPGRFERIALLGVGDNVFEDADPSVIVAHSRAMTSLRTCKLACSGAWPFRPGTTPKRSRPSSVVPAPHSSEEDLASCHAPSWWCSAIATWWGRQTGSWPPCPRRRW